MARLSAKIAQSIVREAWSLSMDKERPSKKDVIKAIKKKCPSRKNFNTLYDLLKPFTNRLESIESLNEQFLTEKRSEHGITKKIVQITQSKKTSLLQKIKESINHAGGQENIRLPYVD